MKLLFKLTLLLILFQILPRTLVGQKLATPLDPGLVPMDKQIGIIIGFGGNNQSGEYLVQCDDCLFENGTGSGFMIGALYEHEFANKFLIGLAGYYDNMSITSSYREREPIDFVLEGTNEIESIPILFRHRGEVDISYFTAMPYIKWNIAHFFFIKLGIAGSFVMNASIKHTQEALDRSVLLKNGETATVSFGDGPGNTRVIENGDFPQVNSFQISLVPIAAFNFNLSKRLHFSPVFQYNMPFTNVSEFGNDFKISSWRFALEFRYSLNPEKYEFVKMK